MSQQAKKPIRFVYVEDSPEWRDFIGNMYRQGLKRDDIVYEERGDFSILNKELSSGNPDDIPVDKITKFMNPEARIELDFLFPPQKSGGEKRK